MRAVVALCALLLGCTYETNYYGVSDAGCGVEDMSGYHDQNGEWHEDASLGVFRSDSKLQGNAELSLMPAPALVPVWVGFRFPMIKEDPPAMAHAATLIDLMTRDGLPHVVTLSFGNISPERVIGGGPFTELVALLNIGIGGVSYYAEVDVLEGVQYSLATNRLQAHLVYRTPPGGGAVPTPVPTVSVGMSASSGVVAHGRQPQRTLTHAGTVAVPAIAAGPVLDNAWVIPPFAKTLRVVAVPANSQLNVEFLTDNGAQIIAVYPVIAPATQEYPIPSSAHYVVVQNAAQNTVWAYSLIFELAL